MRSPLVEFPFYKGSLVDRISNTALTVRGSMPLQKTVEKGWAAFTNNNANSYTFNKVLNGTYSVVCFLRKISDSGTHYIADFTTSSGTGYLGFNNSVFTSANGTKYINNVAITTGNIGRFNCYIVTGITIVSTVIALLTSFDFASNLNGYCAYFAIYSGTLTEKERAEIQIKFENLTPLAKPSNLIKEIRPVVNFDLNINGNCYVTVPDNDKLDFGTGSFSIAWEDSYPQQQSAGYASILSKGQTSVGVANTFGLFHNNTTTNALIYRDSTSNSSFTNSLTLLSSIPNGTHKFLLVRNSSDTKIYLYCNGSLVYTSAAITMVNLTNALELTLKIATYKSNGSFKNLKIWKGQALTWKQAYQNPVYKTGLSLHLPMDEGGGLTVYDKSGNGLNGTITQTAAYNGNVWVKKAFPSDIVLYEDWSYQAADGTVRTPNGWIKDTGSYKIMTATQDLGVHRGVKKGENYLECTVAGTIAIPCKWAYGTIEIDLLKGADANTLDVGFVNSSMTVKASATASNFISITAAEAIALLRNNTTILASNSAYVANTTWYRLKITRSITGEFYVYIKGGAFGNSYQLVSVTGGSGTNPITSNTYTSSNFLVIDNDAGDLVGKIIGSTQVY